MANKFPLILYKFYELNAALSVSVSLLQSKLYTVIFFTSNGFKWMKVL